MLSFRSLLTFLVSCLAWCGLAGAVTVTQGPTAQSVPDGIALRWETDAECGTTVKYGLDPNALNKTLEGELGKSHKVTLPKLTPNKTYYFSIGTSKRSLQKGHFQTDSNGLFGGVAPVPNKAVEKGPANTVAGIPMPATQATKPAAKPAPAPAVAKAPASEVPPTRQTWGSMPSLMDHYVRHGRDFAAKNADDYAAKAWLFLQRGRKEGFPAKVDPSDGTIRVWEGKTRSFAAYNSDFTTKTFFRPNSPDYFQRQPGRPVVLKTLQPSPRR